MSLGLGLELAVTSAHGPLVRGTTGSRSRAGESMLRTDLLPGMEILSHPPIIPSAPVKTESFFKNSRQSLPTDYR